MSPQDVKRAILEQSKVSRPDIEAAKAKLAEYSTGVLTIEAAATQWAEAVSGYRWQNQISIDSGDTGSQVAQAACWIKAFHAFAFAAAEWVRLGYALAGPTVSTWRPQVGYQSRQGAGPICDWKELEIFHPERLLWPSSLVTVESSLDGDLFLRRVGPLGHPGIEAALRMSLDCFRAGLYVPSVAMMGAASEGAWVEMGTALANRAGDTAVATALGSWQVSAKQKIQKVLAVYRSVGALPVRESSGVRPADLELVSMWSDHVREARNVLHWTAAAPTVPNDYEKVAVLLMGAGTNLGTLNRIRLSSC